MYSRLAAETVIDEVGAALQRSQLATSYSHAEAEALVRANAAAGNRDQTNPAQAPQCHPRGSGLVRSIASNMARRREKYTSVRITDMLERLDRGSAQ